MIVVTGGAGFIGSNLVAGLEARGEHEIVVCDRMGEGDKWRNLAKRELARLIAPEALESFVRDRGGEIEAIFHLGAISATTERNADRLAANNFELSLLLWALSAEHDIRFFYASSAATYGAGEHGFDDAFSVDALAHLKPLNPYGWSKHAFDRRVARMLADGAAKPPQWAGFKFFNVYGPNEYHKGDMRSVAVQVHDRAANGEPARLFRSHHPDYRDGGQKRDFIWVGDCVDVMLWFLDHGKAEGLYNLGTGRARSFADLAAATFAALGQEPNIEYIDTPAEIREKYQYLTEARMDRLRAAGWARDFTSLEDGVARYVKDFLSAEDPYL